MKNLIFPLFMLTLASSATAAMDVNFNNVNYAEDEEFNLAILASLESFDQQQRFQSEQDEMLNRAVIESLDCFDQQQQRNQIEMDGMIAQRFQEEDNNFIDEDTADLINQLQILDLLQEDPHYYQPPESIGILFKTVAYESPEATNTFNKLKEDLLKIYKSTKNVHAADQFIKNNAQKLIQISTILDPHLSPEIKAIHNENLVQLHKHLLNLLKPYQDRLNHFTYENTSKNYNEIIALINGQFNKSKNEIGSYANNIGTRLWARFIALAAARLNDPYTSDELKGTVVNILAEKAIEGLITRGGCIQGFVNRGFVGLMTMLTLDIEGQ
jgi:hypothetical protein